MHKHGSIIASPICSTILFTLLAYIITLFARLAALWKDCGSGLSMQSTILGLTTPSRSCLIESGSGPFHLYLEFSCKPCTQN